ncbi:hypothetical protein EON65_50855 [archaeon]|nr:MAG: hypothetical protein EON65_50855 [archaeon]
MKDILLAAKCFDFLDARKEGFLSKATQEEALLKARQRDFDRQLELEKMETEYVANLVFTPYIIPSHPLLHIPYTINHTPTSHTKYPL